MTMVQRTVILNARRLLLVAVGASIASWAQATDLMQAWQAAQQHDLDYVAAQAAHEAGQARRDQSNALWRPTLQATGTTGRMTNDSQTQGAQFYAPGFPLTNNAVFNTSINNGMMDRWALSARQPLLNRERLAQSRQLDLNAEVAELEWQTARQDLMLHTAQRYFDVAMAQEALRVARRQEQSVEKALGEVKARYQLGDVPITDTHEAAARMEAIRAQILAAETDLQLKQAALSDATGLPMDRIEPLQPTRGDLPPPGASLEQWTSDATAGNPGLRTQLLRVDVAREESARYSALASPSLDLVGEVTRDHLSGSGDYGAANNVMHTTLVGLQLTIPIYTGGLRSARHDETQRLADKALTDSDRTRQQVALQTRAAWLGLTAGAGRVRALAAALKASQSRLEATRLGHKMGDRSTLDLLNAENDAANARLSWLQARVAVMMNRLQLAALAGKLEESQLHDINLLLEPAVDEANPPSSKP